MRYELINPSDYAEFRAETREDALVAVVILGHGLYGARRLDQECPDDDVPIMPFGLPDDVVGVVDFALTERPLAIANGLDSLCLPRTNQTSINDFCTRARQMAAALRARNDSGADADGGHDG